MQNITKASTESESSNGLVILPYIKGKTSGLRSGNSSDFGLAYLKVFVPVIFQFSDMHNENRFLDTFRGLNIHRAGARTLIGGRGGGRVYIFIYSGSARLVSFVIKLISKEITRA